MSHCPNTYSKHCNSSLSTEKKKSWIKNEKEINKTKTVLQITISN